MVYYLRGRKLPKQQMQPIYRKTYQPVKRAVTKDEVRNMIQKKEIRKCSYHYSNVPHNHGDVGTHFVFAETVTGNPAAEKSAGPIYLKYIEMLVLLSNPNTVSDNNARLRISVVRDHQPFNGALENMYKSITSSSEDPEDHIGPAGLTTRDRVMWPYNPNKYTSYYDKVHWISNLNSTRPGDNTRLIKIRVPLRNLKVIWNQDGSVQGRFEPALRVLTHLESKTGSVLPFAVEVQYRLWTHFTQD